MKLRGLWLTKGTFTLSNLSQGIGLVQSDVCTWPFCTSAYVSTLYFSNNLLTFSKEKNPSWGANRFSASQEIHLILWNQKVHYRIHNSPPPVPILSQLDPVHTPTSHFLKIHLKIILPSTPGSHMWSIFLRYSHQNLYVSTLPYTRYMPRPPHSSRYDHPNNIGWLHIIKLLIMQFSPFLCSLIPLRP